MFYPSIINENFSDTTDDYHQKPRKIYKRTLRKEPSDTEYEYQIRPNVQCIECKKSMPLTVIDKATPNDGHKVPLQEKVIKEKEALSKCPQCLRDTLKVTLIISKCKIFSMNRKRKFEYHDEIKYSGSFSLFWKLREFHNEEIPQNRSSPKKSGSHSLKYNGVMKEISCFRQCSKLLQLDVIQLFQHSKELFWNLMYRFIKDKKDYIFLLPYEADILGVEDKSQNDHNAGSDMNSESIENSPANSSHFDMAKNMLSKNRKRRGKLLDDDEVSQKDKRISEKF